MLKQRIIVREHVTALRSLRGAELNYSTSRSSVLLLCGQLRKGTTVLRVYFPDVY